MKRQNWYFIFSEASVFRNRYIRFFGTLEECRRNKIFWKLDNLVSAVLPEQDFIKGTYSSFKELNIEVE